MKAKTTTTPRVPRQITGHVMYMGPNFPQIGLYFNRVYKPGAVDKHLYQYIAQCPPIGEMFISISNVAMVMRELNFDYAHNMRGTTGRFVIFYREIQKWIASTMQQKTTPAGVQLEEHHHHA